MIKILPKMRIHFIHTWFDERGLVGREVVVGGADEAVVDGEVRPGGRQVGARVRKRLERVGTPEMGPALEFLVIFVLLAF